MTKSRIARGLICLLGAVMAGCASTSYSVSGISEDQVSAEEHIRFLAKPDLDGRRPKSAGSMRARRYIVRQFEAHGLQPWGNAEGFCQPVKFGTNVIGVLPGQDPALANEVVLVSAHYDHLGHGKLGAVDNASGVGILLDLLHRMSQPPLTNKRSVCFAAFDCEERPVVWGALAFTRRPDFDPACIAAVINVDMVGRPAFDCMQNTVFLGRSHAAPALMDSVNHAANDAGLRVLPYHLLLPGPTGDHAAFSALGIPSFFVSTGYFSGYHTRMDVVGLLDWNLVRKTCDVTCETLQRLAAASTPIGEPLKRVGDRDDLKTVREVLTAQLKASEVAREDKASREKIQASVNAIDQALAAESYTQSDAYLLLQDALVAVMPRLSGSFAPSAAYVEWLNNEVTVRGLVQQAVEFGLHQEDILAMYGQIADVALENGPLPTANGAGKVPPDGASITWSGDRAFFHPPDLGLVSYPLIDDEIAVMEMEDGTRHLGVLFPKIRVSIWNLNKPLAIPRGDFQMQWERYGCRGDTDALIDYCLVHWSVWACESGVWDSEEERARAWSKVLQRVAPSRPVFDTYEEAFAYRLKETGCSDRRAWRLRMLRSRNPQLIRAIGGAIPSPVTSEEVAAYRDILFDTAIPVDIRANAVTNYGLFDFQNKVVRFDAQVLRDLKALTGDVTPIPRQTVIEQPTLPAILELAALIESNRLPPFEIPEKEKGNQPPITIGDAARTRLNELAAAAGLEDIENAKDGITLPGPFTLTAFPSGVLTVDMGPSPCVGVGLSPEEEEKLLASMPRKARRMLQKHLRRASRESENLASRARE